MGGEGGGGGCKRIVCTLVRSNKLFLLTGVATTTDTKAPPHLPSISCHIHQCVSAFLNSSNVLQSVVLHVYIFVSQE